MARDVFPGAFTAETDETVVVFLIGMRINNFLDPRRWVTTAMQMGPMLRVLMQHREKGLLHFETFVNHRGVMLVQYWRSYDELERFARNPDDPHLGSWRTFNRMVANDPSVGVWHETYVIEPGRSEGIYRNMPAWGMAAATRHRPIGAGRTTARERLQAT